MLVINANQEQMQVFGRLIEEMGAQVVWNGRFVIMGDRLILEGLVRSLFFHFDIQKVSVELAELPDDDGEELEIQEYPGLADLITIAVYAFDKFGVIKGIDSEKDVQQLNQVFGEILGIYHLKSDFSEENIEFYKSGMRITYEDVLDTVIAQPQARVQIPMLEMPALKEAGADRTQVLDSALSGFKAVSDTEARNTGAAQGADTSQAAAERIEKYHARIGVLDRLSELQRKTLLRDIRNDKLLTDQEKEDLYYPIRDYEEQEKRNAMYAAGGGGNSFEPGTETVQRNSQAAAERIEKYHARIGVLDRLSDLQRKTLLRDIRNDNLLTSQEKEALYYPIQDYEEQEKQNAANGMYASEGNSQGPGTETVQRNSQAAAERIEKYHARIGVLDRLSDLQRKTLLRDIRNDNLLTSQEKEALYYPIQDYEEQEKQNAANGMYASEGSKGGNSFVPGTGAVQRNSQAAAERIEKYHARIGVLDRLSELQRKTLVRDIRNDRLLNDLEKESLYYPIQDYEYQEKMSAVSAAFQECEGSYFACAQKLIQKTEQEDLFEQTKQAVLEKLKEMRQQFGIQEVKNIMDKVPAHVERAEYKELIEKLTPYEGIDFSIYKEPLRKMRETLEIKEISNMLMQSQKKDRKDYMDLLRRIEDQDFAEENASPYIERILDWVSEIDEARLKELLLNVSLMDFDTALSAYRTICKGSFLPALKDRAKASVSRRLEEICLGECRLLVRAFEQNMAGVIKENPRHHFYPAEKILAKTAVPEETRLIESAVSAYAERRSRFEYPILMVDTSKECNGRDGMLLTPEHLFYSTRLNGYRMAAASIKSVYVSSGLLNHRALIAEEANGVRHRLPYAVEAEELKDWAELLDKFIRFLNTRKMSGKLAYEPLEDEDQITCKRCGCVYEDRETCPECGYKKNR